MRAGVTLAAALSVVALAGEAAGRTAIVVNVGAFPDARAAAGAEEKVDWLDGDANDDAVCTGCFAAVELQHHLRRATGRKDDFAIVDDERPPAGADWIVVGSADMNAAARTLGGSPAARRAEAGRLGPQGYRIRTLRRDGRRVIHLSGGGRVGTLYAAYDLLHRLGFRWFAPGPVHEDIPRIDDLGEHDVTSRPAFLTRGFHAWENRGDEAFLLWMARNRLNYWCVEQRQRALMRKLGIRMACGAHDAQARFLDPARAYPYDHPKFAGDDARRAPADPYPLSKLYRGDANKDGTLSTFEAHPEWFPLVKGRRVPGVRGSFGTNYCTSNPHATAEFMRSYVRALVDGAYRDADVVRFWMLDGGRWCECDACRALGSPTDRNLLLVHQLDRAIKRARRAGRIHRPLIVRFLVYADLLAPPSRPLPEGFDYATCSATYFPISRSYVFDFLDPRSRSNARYVRQLAGWVREPKRHWRGALCLGEYYNVSGFKCLPVCYMHTMAKDIPAYHELGARHFHYMHCTTANMGNKALTNWQMARQLWDVRTDCRKLWADYFARRYGPAARTMRAFYESLERMFCNVRELKYGLARRLDGGAKDLFPTPELRYERAEGVACSGPTFLEIVAAGKQCRQLIDRAAAMKLPKRVAARIAEDERLFAYGERTIAYYHACIEAWRAIRSSQPEAAREHLAEAERLAGLLRKDTASTKHSSSHANAADALAASRAARAPGHIRRRLGQAKPRP